MPAGAGQQAGGAPSLAELIRGRLLILGALAALVVVSWAYLYVLAGQMAAGMRMTMPDMVMAPAAHAWTRADLALTLLMWVVMMTGMMLPSAAPMILTFATVSRRRRARGAAFVPASVFTAGYLIVWGLFSIAATAAQWGLASAAQLSSMMGALRPAAAGAVFVAAGVYQFTPLKFACLSHCRSPFDVIVNRWREGRGGALRMGMEHGAFCVGCCWVLMALMFAEGAMNLLWAAALAAFVFAEKLFPVGHRFARASGVLMLGFGAYLLTRH